MNRDRQRESHWPQAFLLFTLVNTWLNINLLCLCVCVCVCVWLVHMLFVTWQNQLHGRFGKGVCLWMAGRAFIFDGSGRQKNLWNLVTLWECLRVCLCVCVCVGWVGGGGRWCWSWQSVEILCESDGAVEGLLGRGHAQKCTDMWGNGLWMLKINIWHLKRGRIAHSLSMVFYRKTRETHVHAQHSRTVHTWTHTQTSLYYEHLASSNVLYNGSPQTSDHHYIGLFQHVRNVLTTTRRQDNVATEKPPKN